MLGLLAVGLVGVWNPGWMPGGLPWLVVGELRQGLEWRPRPITRALLEEHQFAAETTRTENQERTIPCKTQD